LTRNLPAEEKETTTRDHTPHQQILEWPKPSVACLPLAQVT